VEFLVVAGSVGMGRCGGPLFYPELPAAGCGPGARL